MTTTETCCDELSIDGTWFVCRRPAGHPGHHTEDGDETDDHRRYRIEWERTPDTVPGEVIQ